MLVMFIVLLVLLVPALVVLAFAAYPRQGHRLPPSLDPYPRVEAAQERLRPHAERLEPVADRLQAAADRAAPAVDRVRTMVEHTDARLQRLVGESPARRSAAAEKADGQPVKRSKRSEVPPVPPVPPKPAAAPQRATPVAAMPPLPVRPVKVRTPAKARDKILAKSAARAATKTAPK
ncbi:MAG: hypothetical protein J2P24_18260 [Streptosporangiales bacterium]|nr:hypothetical protein [Streptosporangiales bacterium]